MAQLSKAPQGNERGALGSKNPPCILELLFFTAQHGSENPGLVLRPLSPYAIASLGVAQQLGGGSGGPDGAERSGSASRGVARVSIVISIIILLLVYLLISRTIGVLLLLLV